jgi:hypothetical protein
VRLKRWEMNTKNVETDSTTTELNKFSVLSENIFTECTYGLEYVIDDLFPQVERNVIRQTSIKWAGLDDLII